MLPLDGLHVKVDGARFGIGADGSIAGVGEGAGLAVAETCDVIFVPAEVLLFGGSVVRCDVSYGHYYGKEEKAVGNRT